MPLVKFRDIPGYLRNSELYKLFGENGDTYFYVPQSCFCLTSTGVNSVHAFEHLLRTLHFWIVPYPPRDVLQYVLTNDVCQYKHSHPALWKLLQSFQFGEEFLQIKRIHPGKRIQFAIKNRFRSPLVGDLITLGHTIPSNMCTLAILVNRIDLLQIAVENGCELRDSALLLAVFEARIDMLRCFYQCGMFWKRSLVVAAAKRGQMRSLQFFEEIGVNFDVQTSAAAAAAGHLHCLQYLHKHGAPVDASVVVAVARSDKLACMQYAVEHGAALTSEVTFVACANDSINCLEYALQRRCPINIDATLAAVRVGSFRCLLLAHRHGAPWDEDVCAEAALHGHLNCLVLAHGLGCPWNEKTIANAVWSGHWQCRTFAVQHGCYCLVHGFCVICILYTCFLILTMVYFPSSRGPFGACLVIINGGAVCAILGEYLHLLQRRWPCIDWQTVRTVMINCVAIFAFGSALYVVWKVLYLVYLLIVLALLLVKLLSVYALWYLAELLLELAEAEDSMIH